MKAKVKRPRAGVRPLIKFAGGKAAQADTLRKLLRKGGTGCYREPCVGAGGAFLLVAHERRPAVLCDIDPEIIDLHRAAQQYPEPLIVALARLQRIFDATAGSWDDYARAYANLRAADPRPLPLVERAARTIALNKLAHGGLYRKNLAGEFNAPIAIQGRKLPNGGARVVRIYDADNVRAVSHRLQGVALLVRDLVTSIDEAEPGDLLYTDMPYAPRQEGGFTGYGGHPFTWEDQMRAAQALCRARDRGVFVATSNHDLPHVRALYPGFHTTRIAVRRPCNRKGTKRGRVPEVLFRSFR
jgi:DNA adenine methylase